MRLSSRTAAVAEGVGDEERKILLPGGGPMARLPRLIGSGRPLETLPSDNDLNGALAERYGSVDRALPDGELEKVLSTLFLAHPRGREIAPHPRRVPLRDGVSVDEG